MSGAFRIRGAGRLNGARAASLHLRRQAAIRALEGDTLASALLANGVHLVGRSFKYHRPRGILSAGAEEPNALVGIHRDAARKTPNVRATVQELHDGLTAVSQNRWPSLAFDVGAVNDLASPLFSAGFYYKTFMWPKAAWEAALRAAASARAAGLGVAPDEPDPDHYASRYAHCDVLVVGGGAAGLAAALAAGRGGRARHHRRRAAEFGGALRFETGATIDGTDGWDWAQATVGRSWPPWTMSRVLPRTTAFGYYAQNFVGLVERVTDHLATPGMRPAARAAVAGARGARWSWPPARSSGTWSFADNDRPGIMLASAARTYLNHYGVARRQQCRRLHGERFGLCTPPSTCRRPASTSPPSSTCATSRPAPCSTRRRALGIEVLDRPRRRRDDRRPAARLVDGGRAASRRARRA